MKELIALEHAIDALKLEGTNNAVIFFKTGKGEYAEHDQFIGVPIPKLRTLAKTHRELRRPAIQQLLKSPFNEKRLLALFILIHHYERASIEEKEITYQFYLKNLKRVNNWNLVDASAHRIMGAHLATQRDKSILPTLAQSTDLWERRVAIIATWYFIRQGRFQETVRIAKLLLHDEHDLIHKAVGWMLREMGKRDERTLVDFLDKHAHRMPRTMLRYAIEKFDERRRKAYLLAYSQK